MSKFRAVAYSAAFFWCTTVAAGLLNAPVLLVTSSAIGWAVTGSVLAVLVVLRALRAP